MVLSVGWVVAVAVLASCSFTKPRNPVPPNLQADAGIAGIPYARYWADTVPQDLDAQLDKAAAQRKEAGVSTDLTLLALSGGGDEGAYGAGLLDAWTANGDRPEFTFVTGVSTGALTAPFAFLGADYDAALKEVYGGLPPEDVFTTRSLLGIFEEASLADSAPLQKVIAEFVDEGFLEKVAAEHRRGRRLIVQSTNMDAQRPVIWDLGAIADSGAPNAVNVFREALLASASIPVAFPPVLIGVTVEGRDYDEMHADGGVVSESTVVAGWQGAVRQHLKDVDDERTSLAFYVIRNGRITPEPATVDYNIKSVASRAVSTLVKYQGVANTLIAYDIAQERGAKFFVTWIDEGFDTRYAGPFDQGYMTALFDYGYAKMRDGKAWSARLPVLEVSD